MSQSVEGSVGELFEVFGSHYESIYLIWFKLK